MIELTVCRHCIFASLIKKSDSLALMEDCHGLNTRMKQNWQYIDVA